jgi:hypothetical protein
VPIDLILIKTDIMKKTVLIIFCLLAMAACTKKPEADFAELTKGMNDYLAQHGEICLSKNDWPVDVTQHDMDTNGRNAVQMPVMEKAGLVHSSVATVEVKNDDGGEVESIKVMRYELTDAGKKYYLHPSKRRNTSGNMKEISGDLCAGKLTLDKIVAWEPAKEIKGQERTIVTYTYNIDAAEWAKKPEFQKVFPMVAYVVNGEKTVQLKERFALTPQGWKSVDM